MVQPSTSSSRPRRLLAKLRSVVSLNSGSDSAEGTTTESANEPVSERRREQIRRAQRLHRQRKAEQSQRVTAEIADLRAKDAAKTARIDHLENTITFLSNLLNQHGILHQMPKFSRPPSQAKVTVHESPSPKQHSPTQRLRVTMPTSPTSRAAGAGVVNPSVSFESTSSASISLPAAPPPLSPLRLSPAPSPPTEAPAPDILADLDDAQLGIDFILSLEQPCLYHHHGPATDEDDLLGHSSLMQAPIMARAPPLVRSVSNTQPHLPPSSSWSVPGEELERLLSFSNQLRLPGEITPVQAWSRIRECAAMVEEDGWRPSQTDLNHLLDDLKGVVTCYGFGAVIEKNAFERLLNRYTRRE